MRIRHTGVVLLVLIVSCAAEVGEVDGRSSAVDPAGEPRNGTAPLVGRSGGTYLDALQWPERIGLERALAEGEERYQPRPVRGGVALGEPSGPSALVGPHGAALNLGKGRDVRLAVVSVGRDGAPCDLANASPKIAGAEVRRELAPGVSEWWRALPSGLEHGITLDRRPGGEGPLLIDVEVGGAAARVLSDDSVELVSVKSGAVIAPYAHLLVTDADGARMPAHMSVLDDLVRIEVRDAGARYPLVVDPLVEEATLLASSAAMDDSFGWTVALSADGSRALVGAPLDDTAAGENAGSARVFLRSGASWMEEAALLASDAAAFDNFGYSAALSADGSRALVGAINDRTAAGGSAGSAHVFVRTGTSWMEEATLLALGAAAGDWFGFSVALSSDGSRALVGAFDAGGTRTGSARAFVRSGTSWMEEATLLPSGAAVGDHVGVSVALSSDGSRALLGAHQNDTAAGADAGSAHVFVRSGTSWMEEATLLASGAAAGDWFGWSAALAGDGTRALVGAPRDDTAAGTMAGSARVFVRSGTSWIEEATLLPAVAGSGDGLGVSVALTSDGIGALVGASRAGSTLGGGRAGNASAFARSGTSWMAEVTLVASGAASDDRFGYAVALSSDGSRALVGVPDDDTAAGRGAGSARVFVFRAPAPDGTACGSAPECSSGFCTDGVCCVGACGGGAIDDCEACSLASGGTADGSCTALSGAAAPTVTCRAVADTCDVADACSSTARACPSDAFATSTTPCRPSAGTCDNAETCTGSDAVCPSDAFAASTVECRASVGFCDLAETCTGGDAACPVDAFVAALTPCADGDACNGDELCRGPICSRGSTLDCDDGDACTADACDATSGCSNAPIDGCCLDDLACNDSDACTDDACSATGGTCTNAPIAGCGADAGSSEDAGVAGDSGSLDAGAGRADAGSAPPEDGGCACRAAISPAARHGPRLWLAALLVLVVARRRRRASGRVT